MQWMLVVCRVRLVMARRPVATDGAINASSNKVASLTPFRARSASVSSPSSTVVLIRFRVMP